MLCTVVFLTSSRKCSVIMSSTSSAYSEAYACANVSGAPLISIVMTFAALLDCGRTRLVVPELPPMSIAATSESSKSASVGVSPRKRSTSMMSLMPELSCCVSHCEATARRVISVRVCTRSNTTLPSPSTALSMKSRNRNLLSSACVSSCSSLQKPVGSGKIK